MTDAYNLLVNWKQNPQNYVGVMDGAWDGAMFVTTEDGSQNNGSSFTGKCWICKQTGHQKNECLMKSEQTEKELTKSEQSAMGTQLLMLKMTVVVTMSLCFT
jgi:hypothetical protein